MKNFYLLIGALGAKLTFVSFVLSVSAITASAGSNCAAFKDPDMRRGCELREQILPKFDESGQPSLPNWKVHKKTSTMTDAADVFLSVESDAAVSCGLTSASKPVVLAVRCFDNTTGILLSTHCHMASGFGGYGDIQYRVDKNQAKSRGFLASTDNDTLGLEGYRSTKAIIKEMMAGKTIVIRFTPFNESPKEASFNISGLSEAIEPLRKSCGW